MKLLRRHPRFLISFSVQLAVDRGSCVVQRLEFLVKKAEIIVADPSGNLVDGKIGVGEIETGLAHPLEDDQFFKGAAGLLLDQAAEIIGMKTEMSGGGSKGGSQAIFLDSAAVRIPSSGIRNV